MPDGWLFDRVNRINNIRLARRIQIAIKQLGFEDFIFFNDSSMFLGLHLKELLQPRVYVYYMRDYLTKNPFWSKHGVRIEPQLIRKADVVVNNSLLYTEYGLKYNPHSYMVGQGCDVEAYNDDLQEITIAPELADLTHPVIGYVGFLSNRRLNIELLETLAEKRPEWTFVFVGPEDDDFSVSRLHQMKNVIFTGSKEPETLPGWIKGFDVCLNPQRINDATTGNYPRKIDEYLAMGKPTVASKTKAMEYFREYTYLGETAGDYLILIERAIQEDNPKLREARKKFARSHTWENNVKAIYDAILKIEPNLKN
ncbi:MAG: glycosyltransferase [Bacteroidales bacterium]|nr:glycosyltransferase [Bacteroidales bacterium]